MVLIWRLGLGPWGNETRLGGAGMVINHIGRKTGRVHHTPLNIARIGEHIYGTAGFGQDCDWYQNIQAEPREEVWPLTTLLLLVLRVRPCRRGRYGRSSR